MKLYAKLVIAISMLVAVTNIAHADYTTSPDAAGRKYYVPSEGALAGKKLMELSAANLNGRYKIRCKTNTDFGFDVSGGGTPANSTNVQIWGVNQEFELIHVSGGNYRIRYAGGTNNNMYVNTSNNGTTKPNFNTGDRPVNINVYTGDSSSKDQLFKFIKNDDGSFTIASSWDDNWVFDVEGGTMEQGKNIRFWESNNSNAQKWLLEPVSLTNTGRTIPDYYFERYLVEQGFVQVYNEETHKITGTAKNADYGLADAGYHEHMVIVNPEQITEFNKMGEYGKYWEVSSDRYKKHFEGINNLKGIEYFTGLKKLEMGRYIPGDDFSNYGGNYNRLQMANIDLKYNTELEYLDLNYANFKQVDFDNSFGNTGIDKLSKLKYLNLSNNYFHSVDIRPFPLLQRFEIAHNFSLKRIRANYNENMEELAIFDSVYGYYDNQKDDNGNPYNLQTLCDYFPNLVMLHAFSTMTYELDLTRNPKLQSIWLLKSAYGSSNLAVTDGKYMIYSFLDRTLGLDCAGGGDADGTNVRLWTTSKTSAHHVFEIKQTDGKENNNQGIYSDDYFTIRPTHSARYINANLGGKAAPGAGDNVSLWTGVANNSKWKFIKNSDGSYTIVSKANEGLVLDIDNAVFKEGTNVKLWNNTGNDAQKWILVPLEMSANSRQEAKGTFLHKLDLSNCPELRDVHVQNQHLASLNITSTHIGEALTAPYKDWKVMREVTNTPSAQGDVIKPKIEVNNNYRHVDAELYAWESPHNHKKYWMYYLRTDYNGEEGVEAAKLLDDKKSYFEILSYDNYEGDDFNNANNKSSRKTINVNDAMKSDLFNGKKVMAARLAKEVDNINSSGLVAHTAGHANVTDSLLCMVSHYDFKSHFSNTEVLPAGFMDGITGEVNGSIIILKAGCGDSYPTSVSGLPYSICYDYEMLTNSSRASLPGTFFFDIHYPKEFQNIAEAMKNEIVTGLDKSEIDANKTVESVMYYNVAGQQSMIPFRGVNIVKVNYTDGTFSTTKVIK